MKAHEMADLLEQVPIARRVGASEVAVMLRKQAEEIERLQKEIGRLQMAASDPQLLTSDERRAAGERILASIKEASK